MVHGFTVDCRNRDTGDQIPSPPGVLDPGYFTTCVLSATGPVSCKHGCFATQRLQTTTCGEAAPARKML